MAAASREQLGRMLQQYVTSEERAYGLHKVDASLTEDGREYTLTLSCAGIGRYSTFPTYDHNALRAEVKKLLDVLAKVVAFHYCDACERETVFAMEPEARRGRCVVCSTQHSELRLDQPHFKTLCQSCNVVRTFWNIKIDPAIAVCEACGAQHKRLRPNHWIPLPWKEQRMDASIARLKDVDVGVGPHGETIITGAIERSGHGGIGIGYIIDGPHGIEFVRGVLDALRVDRLARANGVPFMAAFEDNILMKMTPLFDGEGKVFDVRAWREKHKE